MKNQLLQKHIQNYKKRRDKEVAKYQSDMAEREKHAQIYLNSDREQILQMDEEGLYEYISPLWAMLIWGNKRYVVDKLIDDNSLEDLKRELVNLLWSDDSIERRWNQFRKNVKGMGPAMISEILFKTHPHKYMICNRRAKMGLDYLGVNNLPRYDYQLDGKKYKELCNVAREISKELVKVGFEDNSLLMVDYFIWDELQIEETLSGSKTTAKEEKELEKDTSNFIHNDVRDKIRNIGQWLGFEANIERKVASGSKVDTVWESTIGNMG